MMPYYNIYTMYGFCMYSILVYYNICYTVFPTIFDSYYRLYVMKHDTMFDCYVNGMWCGRFGVCSTLLYIFRKMYNWSVFHYWWYSLVIVGYGFNIITKIWSNHWMYPETNELHRPFFLLHIWLNIRKKTWQ